MDATIYTFPAGDKQFKPLPAWVPSMSAGVWFIGERQTLVPDRENVFTKQPYFLVQLYNTAAEDRTASFGIEVEGVKGLHATLNLFVDAARTRDQDFTVADYSDGETKLPEEYRMFLGQE